MGVVQEKLWQVKSVCGKFHQATVAAGFQRTFPVCEAFRGSSWQLQGAGAMPAPYCLLRARITRCPQRGLPMQCRFKNGIWLESVIREDRGWHERSHGVSFPRWVGREKGCLIFRLAPRRRVSPGGNNLV
jgi:hypothetical protein